MYIFEKPIRKVGYYIAPIVPKTRRRPGETADINVRSCRIDMCEPLPRGKGFLLSFYIEPRTSASNAINELDDLALAAVVENNRRWFNNALGEEDIRGFWRPSMAQQNSFLVSTVSADPEMLGKNVSIVLTAVGITIKQQGFKIAWRLKEMHLIGGGFVGEGDGDGEDIVEDVNKAGIEAFWGREVAAVGETIDGKIADIRRRLEYLEGLKAKMGELLAEAVAEEGVNGIWNARLAALEGEIGDFRSGTAGR